MKNTFYLTTTLPYVNAQPHIGFALEILAADVIARYQINIGNEVVFNTGTDEHGQKIYQTALENGQEPQEYVDLWAKKFADLKNLLNVDYTHFIRTSNPQHKKAAQEFWKRCKTNGDIYKKLYKTSYCVGCEMEKQTSELENGRCPLHPDKEIEIREEENYFFKFSKYQQDLLNLYEANPQFVKPNSKLKEIYAFVSSGLQDFSISRLKEKMSWGVPVPDDDNHVMYVWFDALVNYISTLGWPENEENFQKFWPGIQLAGKDNLRQQSAMWQAMLMSAKLPNSTQILINGFISVDGQKMSKSIGNVISPEEMVNRYGVEGARFLILNLGPFGSDMDVSWKKFDISYTSLLSNSLGNLCSRVAKLCEKNGSSFNLETAKPEFAPNYQRFMNDFDLKEALELTFEIISQTDQFLSENKPWLEVGVAQKEILETAVSNILQIALQLSPFMPQTAKEIQRHFSLEKISAIQPLFPRLANT